MASLKQKRVSDISFTIDSSLNILDASRGFLRFFNISDKNTNLRFFLDRESITEMLYFVNGYDGSKNIFVSRLYAREEKLDCLFIVKNCQDGEFEMDLIVVDYLYELYNNSTQLNEEYKAFMSNQYSFYFVYDLDSNNVILKNTKYLAVIFEGDYLSFKDSFIKYFNIDTNIDLTAQAFDKLESDVENSYFDKIYKFLLENKCYLTLNTKLYDEKNNYVIGYIELSDEELFIKNDFVEKRDGLTGLYNKVTITEMARNRIENAKLDTTLLIIDLDRFKECNDMYGHAYGDKVILTAAKIISDSVKGIGYAGRIGGDEFLCIIEPTDEEIIRGVTKDIRLGIQWGIEAFNIDSVVTCSIGVSRYPLNCNTYDTLFDLADKCLYIAKNKGRNNYVIYKPEIHEKVLRKTDETRNDMISGKYFVDIFNNEHKITKLLAEKRRNNELLNNLVLEYFGVDKFTVYNEDLKVVISAGKDDINFRSDYIHNNNYFKYLNSYGFLVMDNTNVLDTIDKEKYDMYLSDNICSTIEIFRKDKKGKFKGLICLDKYKPAKTFTNEQILFALHLAKLY